MTRFWYALLAALALGACGASADHGDASNNRSAGSIPAPDRVAAAPESEQAPAKLLKELAGILAICLRSDRCAWKPAVENVEEFTLHHYSLDLNTGYSYSLAVADGQEGLMLAVTAPDKCEYGMRDGNLDGIIDFVVDRSAQRSSESKIACEGLEVYQEMYAAALIVTATTLEGMEAPSSDEEIPQEKENEPVNSEHLV